MHFLRNDSSYIPGTHLPLTMIGTPGSDTTIDTFSYNSRGEVINSTDNRLVSQNRAYTCDPIGNRLSAIEGDDRFATIVDRMKALTCYPPCKHFAKQGEEYLGMLLFNEFGAWGV